MKMSTPPEDDFASALPQAALVSNQAARFGWVFWLCVLVALLAGGAVGWFGARQVHHDDLGRQYQLLASSYELNMAQNQHDQQALQARLDATEGRLLVEESTRKSLEAALSSTQAELGQVRDQLAFFDRLLPPGPSGALSIRALDIEQRGPILHYKALFMRNAPGGEKFTGRMAFTAGGTLDGKAVKLPLDVPKVADALTAAPGDTALSLDFEQFQRAEGLLALPLGFVPETVTLQVLDGDTVRVSRTINLPAAE